MLERNDWLTYAEAMLLTGRSKRTLNRWMNHPGVTIRTWRPARSTLLLRDDVMAAEATMDSRSEHPAFGKPQA